MTAEATNSRKETNIIKPPKTLMRQIGKALMDFDMIHEGDRLLLGLSGGKDSLSLLHILHHLQSYAPVKFKLGAMTVDPEIEGFDPSHLKSYTAALGIPYFYEQQPIAKQAEEQMKNDSFCSFCSRMKRGIMYSTCRREGYNVLVLAQHLDDLAESFMMSAFRGGQLRTMKANYTNKEGDVRIIRPMVYVRERQTADFAREAGLPVVPDSCPACFAMPTEREHMKQLLAQEEKHNKGLFKSLLTAMQPLIQVDSAD
ncbi:MAG: tRNA 2-thiocytidine biosynthesis protein TtcA [Gammaproteobacteria bacterium]|nr:tRNA 2-thiocytidine biosynthesis protein TtcA [Gammaproteobacteria bacterium]MDH5778890.1 tRNA 2-thiocytidine biosynthesis protein TtcA [Gammaproteobacteria bacterium]